MKNSTAKQSAELKKARKTRTQSEENCHLTVCLPDFEDEQKRLKIAVSKLIIFLTIFEKYEHITAIIPEIMHELIEKIIVHEVNKFSKNTKVFHKAWI